MKFNRCLFVAALLAFHSALYFASATSEITHALLLVMSKQAKPGAELAAKDLGLVGRHPGVMHAAEKLGRDLPEAERKRIAEILERIVTNEYAQRNVALTCAACVPANLADALDARMMT